jgi:hypothetical protein
MRIQTLSNRAYLLLLLWVITVVVLTDGLAALVLRPGW